MKIKPDDLASLTAMVKPKDTPEVRAIYLSGKFPRADKVKDLNMRFRWDLLWMADRVQRQNWISTVYQYANDDHVDTALRSIVPSLTSNDSDSAGTVSSSSTPMSITVTPPLET